MLEHNVNELENFINEYNKRPSFHSKNKKEKLLSKFIGTNNQNYKNKKYIMKEEEIYNIWGNFINENQELFLSNEELWKNKLEEVKEYIIKSKSSIRELTKNACIREGKFGPYIYYKTDKMNKPKFISLKGFKEDYEKCTLDQLKEWVKTKHKISI